MKSLRTKEFGWLGLWLGFGGFIVKRSDRDYYKSIRGKWHFIAIPLAISGSSPPP